MICLNGTVVASPAANTPGTEVWPRLSTMISPCLLSSIMPFSHSVLGTKPICTNTPSSSTCLALAADAVGEAEAVQLVAVAGQLGRLRLRVDGDIGQALELVDQHRVGAQGLTELDQRDMGRRGRPGRWRPRRPSCRRRSPPPACP